MTPLAILSRVLGLAYVGGLLYGLYVLYDMSGQLLRLIPNPERGIVADFRIPIAIIVAILAASLANWLWTKTLGRLDPPE